MSEILDLKTTMMTLIWKTHAVIKDVYVCVHAMLVVFFFIGLIYLLTKD